MTIVKRRQLQSSKAALGMMTDLLSKIRKNEKIIVLSQKVFSN